MKIELAFNTEINGFQYCKGAVLNVDDEGGATLLALGHTLRNDDTPARKNAGLYQDGQCVPAPEAAPQSRRQKPPAETIG